MELVVASQNPNKIFEIKKTLPPSIQLTSLLELEIEDIPETGKTLSENALIKARFVNRKLNKNCFSDDSGLEVDALDGEPGVYSARYAGEPKNDLNNIKKLLEKLGDNLHRKACFKTVIALIIDSKEYLFEGKVEGEIINDLRGENGFGYDPIFIPFGHEKTFAEMSIDEKKLISHRSIAVNKMVDFLSKIQID